MKYTIVLKKQAEGGYTAQCLEIPGAISQGETKLEAVKNAKEALHLVLQVLREESRKAEVVKVQIK
jgi:predicted RNase H-like HicB family nuclease